MRLAFIVGLLTLTLPGHVSAGEGGAGPPPPARKRPAASSAFRVTAASPIGVTAPSAGMGGLDLDSISAWDTEDITVFAKRHIARPPALAQAPVALGSIALSGASKTDQIGFSGVTVTAAIPVAGVPGLDAVANLSGGHGAVSSSTTRESAALTAGFRLKF